MPDEIDFEVDQAGVLHVKAPEPESATKHTAERHALKAARLAKNGDYSKAKNLFLKALELNPGLTGGPLSAAS